MPAPSIWRSLTSFEHRARLRATAEDARAVLGDPAGWARLQPLVLSIEEERERPTFFRIRERVKVLGVPLRNAYRARIVPHPDGVDSEAWSAPFIHLTNRIWWVAEGAELTLIESVQIEAPRPLSAFVTRTAREAHAALVRRIGEAIEAHAREREQRAHAGG